MNGDLPIVLSKFIPENLILKPIPIEKYKIENIIGIDTKITEMGYFCMTTICRKKSKYVNNYLRNQTFINAWLYQQKKSHYPLVYVNNETFELRGTFLSPLFKDNFLKWVTYCRKSLTDSTVFGW